jgi:hypothetical protein
MLTLDGDAQGLAREGRFHPHGSTKAFIEFESSGSVTAGDVTLAAEGTVRVSPGTSFAITSQVKLSHFSRSVNSDEIRRIRNEIEDSTNRADETIDYRGATPVRTSHKDE